VILEIDHIIPVVDGGTNDRANLVTACFDCNRGKSWVPLELCPETVAEQIDRRRELAEQLKALNRLLDEEREQATSDINEIGCYWYDQIEAKKGRYVFGDSRAGSIRRFLTTLRKSEILNAVDMAFGRFGIPADRQHDDRHFRYMCGICWRLIGERTGGPPR
jgi:hypothetical protein